MPRTSWRSSVCAAWASSSASSNSVRASPASSACWASLSARIVCTRRCCAPSCRSRAMRRRSSARARASSRRRKRGSVDAAAQPSMTDVLWGRGASAVTAGSSMREVSPRAPALRIRHWPVLADNWRPDWRVVQSVATTMPSASMASKARWAAASMWIRGSSGSSVSYRCRVRRTGRSARPRRRRRARPPRAPRTRGRSRRAPARRWTEPRRARSRLPRGGSAYPRGAGARGRGRARRARSPCQAGR